MATLSQVWDSVGGIESELSGTWKTLVGFGKAHGGGQVGAEIREAIVRLEKELGVWTSGVRNVLQDAAGAGQVASPNA